MQSLSGSVRAFSQYSTYDASSAACQASIYRMACNSWLLALCLLLLLLLLQILVIIFNLVWIGFALDFEEPATKDAAAPITGDVENAATRK